MFGDMCLFYINLLVYESQLLGGIVIEIMAFHVKMRLVHFPSDGSGGVTAGALIVCHQVSQSHGN